MLILVLRHIFRINAGFFPSKLGRGANLKMLALLLFVVVGGDAVAASQSAYPLEIIQPRAGLDTKNRFYKAYPGLPYNVKAAVVGGAYPYRHVLLEKPSEMSIDALTGEINWPKPIARSTPYPIELRVTDAEGATQTVKWSILVTTEKFMFVDPVNGKNGASGKIDDPVKGFIDVYGGNQYADKYATKNKDYFVYFKGGASYSIDGFSNGEQSVQWTNRQPMVLMAYPGHKPDIEMTKMTFKSVDTSSDNFYLEGFDVHNIETTASSEVRMGFRIGSDSSNVTFRNNVFHGIPISQGAYNQSAIMISRGGASGKYWAISNNEFFDIYNAYGVLGYVASKVLIEKNKFHDFGGGSSHPIGPKTSTSYWFIRANEIYRSNDFGVWLYGNEGGYGDMEVSFNNIKMSNGIALEVNGSYNNTLGPISVFRNTFVGNVQLHNLKTSSSNVSIKDNVIINLYTTGYRCSGCDLLPMSSNNKVASPAEQKLIDLPGNLLDRTKVGTIGFEVDVGFDKPVPPKAQ